MTIRSYACITKPGFLLVHSELPVLTLLKPKLTSLSILRVLGDHERRIGLITKCQFSVSDRTFASGSAGSSMSKPNAARLGQKQGGSSSLYSHPSLLEMKNEKATNRARVYEFLRGIGIIPDELDGLEIPVTAEVMRERVDFLHTLGLTIEDINNYPLVLGCSVKKNMIPVLDYLGKLGVRKSTFTEFLRRYTQLLHSSVVVDLAPVVKYLQGMDIKPNDIPRVLERYPEVLGFKLEGTMSTSVAYLRVKPNVEFLLEFNVRKALLPSVVAQYPEIIGLDLKPKLLSQQSLLNSIIDIGPEDFGKVVEKIPQVISLSKTPVIKRVDFLKNCGFSLQQVRKMVVGCPQLLALNLDIMKLSFDYFQIEMKRPLDDLVIFPAFFPYGLESTIKPRHRMVAKKGLKCSLAWLLNCSDNKFEERLSYDTIDMEEMEIEPSFDMNALMEPRGDESQLQSVVNILAFLKLDLPVDSLDAIVKWSFFKAVV
nr:transcription termination factor mterf4, chloroplastic [Quercus suber]